MQKDYPTTEHWQKRKVLFSNNILKTITNIHCPSRCTREHYLQCLVLFFNSNSLQNCYIMKTLRGCNALNGTTSPPSAVWYSPCWKNKKFVTSCTNTFHYNIVTCSQGVGLSVCTWATFYPHSSHLTPCSKYMYYQHGCIQKMELGGRALAILPLNAALNNQN